MTYIQHKPYLLFLALILVFLVVGFFNSKEDAVINIYDTYYVISYWDLSLLLSFVYGFLAILYFALLKLNFILINWITITHVVISIIGLFLIFVLSILIRGIKPEGFENIIEQMNFDNRIRFGIFVSVCSILAVQFLFFTNIILALIRRKV